MVIQNISASFSELFPNYVPPRLPLPRKVGGHDPPAPMGAPPLTTRPCNGLAPCYSMLEIVGFTIIIFPTFPPRTPSLHLAILASNTREKLVGNS